MRSVWTYLDEDSIASGVDPAESMAPIRREVVPVRRGVVGEQHETCMLRFGDVGEEVEPRVKVEQEVFGVALLRADVVWALEGITVDELCTAREGLKCSPDKEDWPVQTDHVKVAILGIEFDGETSRVSGDIGIFSLRVSLGSIWYMKVNLPHK